MVAVAKLNVQQDAGWDDEIVRRARVISAKLRSRTVEIDRLARIPDDLVAEMIEAGFYDMSRPRAYGGQPVSSLKTILDVHIEIAKGDTGAAWALALVGGSTSSIASLFPEETASEFYATPGGGRAAGTHAWRSCKIRPVDGGVLIEHGVWGFNSGVYQSNWDVLGVPVYDDAGTIVGAGAVLLPISDVNILNDWDTMGLRGSGSSTVEVRDVFVPARRYANFAQGSLFAQANVRMKVPLSERPWDSWLGSVPLALALGNIHFASLALGAAEAAFELFLAMVDKRGISYTHYQKLSDSSLIHALAAKARIQIDLARSVVFASAAKYEAAARADRTLTPEETIRIRGEVGYITNILWEAIDSIATACGGSFAVSSNLIGRQWRDVKVINMHGMAAPTVNLELYGRALCGRPPHLEMV